MCCWEQPCGSRGEDDSTGPLSSLISPEQAALVLPPDPAVHPCPWPVPIAEDEPFGHGSLWVPGQPAVAQLGWPGRCWAPALGQLSPGTAHPRCPGCVPEAAQSPPQEHQRSRCFLCGSLNFTPANNGKGEPGVEGKPCPCSGPRCADFHSGVFSSKHGAISALTALPCPSLLCPLPQTPCSEGSAKSRQL